MKKVAAIAAVALTVGTMSVYAGGIGVVDMKKIFMTAPQVKSIKASLTKRFAPQKAALQKQGDALKADMQKMQKNKAVMSAKDRAALAKTIANEGSTFRGAQTRFQQAVYAAQTASLQGFMTKVKGVVKKVAAKKGLDAVLPKNTVLYSKDGVDLTNQVLAVLK